MAAGKFDWLDLINPFGMIDAIVSIPGNIAKGESLFSDNISIGPVKSPTSSIAESFKNTGNLTDNSAATVIQEPVKTIEQKLAEAQTAYEPTPEVAEAYRREDTAIQRQYQQLKEVGINPILMATNGWTGASSAASTAFVDTRSQRISANAQKSMANTAKVKAIFDGIATVLGAVTSTAKVAMGGS